ncbi:coiled-coil domain-containing protein 78 isoform X3 [Pelodiscus sinensis]|uniref:coiled-coil domain-containing protein 78 isoform X3 n=1 Tax=Pelodiscus sinensis TaxID=13735 RepID=UPI003F6AE09F
MRGTRKTQYQAKILTFQHQLNEHVYPGRAMESESISTLQEQVQRLTNENLTNPPGHAAGRRPLEQLPRLQYSTVNLAGLEQPPTHGMMQLQDRNESLYTKLGELQEKMGKLAGSKTDLSSRLVFSEEEKLKISRDLIDLQIDTNKMKEQYETENFELKNMVLTLENRILELELHNDKVTGERDALQECLHTMETNRKALADEYISLKSNYLALGKAHEQEVAKNEELSIELLNVVHTRHSLPQLRNNYSQVLANESLAELERVRAVVHHLSARKVKPEDIVASEHERRKVERHLLGNQDHIKVEIEKMKRTCDSQQQKLEERVVAMGKELQEAKRAIRNTQHKLAEQSAVLFTSQSQLKEVEAENSQLQLQLKELNQEYRYRLTQYIKDLAEYMDSKSNAAKGPSKEPADHAHMKCFVDSMLKDIRAAYKSREQQLAGAARGYKKRMQNLVRRHENLLIAYRMQREQIQSQGISEMDPGPPEFHFAITDSELLTSTIQELNQLREDKAKLETELNELKEKMFFLCLQKRLHESSALGPFQRKLDEEGWAEIRKQLREFTHTTQEDLERERSQLLIRAIMAEEQLLELQEYVDKHLARIHFLPQGCSPP